MALYVALFQAPSEDVGKLPFHTVQQDRLSPLLRALSVDLMLVEVPAYFDTCLQHLQTARALHLRSRPVTFVFSVELSVREPLELSLTLELAVCETSVVVRTIWEDFPAESCGDISVERANVFRSIFIDQRARSLLETGPPLATVERAISPSARTFPLHPAFDPFTTIKPTLLLRKEGALPMLEALQVSSFVLVAVRPLSDAFTLRITGFELTDVGFSFLNLQFSRALHEPQMPSTFVGFGCEWPGFLSVALWIASINASRVLRTVRVLDRSFARQMLGPDLNLTLEKRTIFQSHLSVFCSLPFG